MQINAGVKEATIEVQAQHESEAGVLNEEVFGSSSGSVNLTPVSSWEYHQCRYLIYISGYFADSGSVA